MPEGAESNQCDWQNQGYDGKKNGMNIQIASIRIGFSFLFVSSRFLVLLTSSVRCINIFCPRPSWLMRWQNELASVFNFQRNR
jgi:hypothetical protein